MKARARYRRTGDAGAKRQAAKRAGRRTSDPATIRDPTMTRSLVEVRANDVAREVRRRALEHSPAFRAWLKASEEKAQSWESLAWSMGLDRRDRHDG